MADIQHDKWADPLADVKMQADAIKADNFLRMAVGPSSQLAEQLGLPKKTIDAIKALPQEAQYSALMQAMSSNPQLANLIVPGSEQGMSYMQNNAMAFTGGMGTFFRGGSPVQAAGQAYMHATQLSASIQQQAYTTDSGKMSYALNERKTGGLGVGELSQMSVHLAEMGRSGLVDNQVVNMGSIMDDPEKKAEVLFQHARAAKVMAKTFGSTNWKEALNDFSAITGQGMSVAGNITDIAQQARLIGATSTQFDVDAKTGAEMFNWARKSLTYQRYGSQESAHTMGMLLGNVDTEIALETQGLAEGYANKMGIKDPQYRKAVGRAVGKAQTRGAGTSGGRALRMFNLLRAGGKIGKEQAEIMQKMLESGDMEGFTMMMQDVGINEFGSVEEMNKIVSDDKAMSTYEAVQMSSWGKPGTAAYDDTLQEYKTGMRETAHVMKREMANNMMATRGSMQRNRADKMARDYGVKISAEDLKDIDKSSFEGTVNTTKAAIRQAEREAEKTNDPAKKRQLMSQAEDMKAQLYVLEREYEKTGNLDQALNALDPTGAGLALQGVADMQKGIEAQKFVAGRGTTQYGMKLTDVEQLGKSMKFNEEEKKLLEQAKTPEEKAKIIEQSLNRMTEGGNEGEAIWAKKKLELFKGRKEGATNAAVRKIDKTDAMGVMFNQMGLDAETALGTKIQMEESDDERRKRNAGRDATTAAMIIEENAPAGTTPKKLEALKAEAFADAIKGLTDVMEREVEINGKMVIIDEFGNEKKVKVEDATGKRNK